MISKQFQSMTMKIYDGVKQNKGGYRYSLDAMMLFYFVDSPKNKNILEIGTGPGIIAIMLARAGAKVTAVELQESLFSRAAENIEELGLLSSIKLIKEDARIYFEGISGTYDCLVCNPPFIKKGAGILPPSQEKAIANHELFLMPEDLMRGAKKALKENGALYLVHRPEREKELCQLAIKNHLYIAKLWRVKTAKNEDIRHILLKAENSKVRQNKPMPLTVRYNENGSFTQLE